VKDPDPEASDPYLAFADRFLQSGQREIPESWPESVRERCRFFLEVMDLGSPAPESLPEVFGPERGILTPGDEPLPVGSEWSGKEPERPPQGEGQRYVVEREIARGGMGRILLAQDRNLRRLIAMKVMLDPERGAASRFLAEAQATAQLEHPNICPVYDVGIDPAGRAFFTMKLVRGRTLKEIMSAGDLSLTRLIQILQQVAMGVDFAHSRGVVHRDLKPSNVMIGDYGEVLVMDWGLAKISSGDSRGDGGASDAISTARSDQGAVTFDGAVQGSVAYMAPEQARGAAKMIDERTDVFGLGAILYHILCGSPPYPEDNPPLALERARRAEIVPPRASAPHRDIPSALEQVCLKALSARKEERHQNAREFHDELQRYIEGIHDAERRAADARRLREVAARHLAEYQSVLEEARTLAEKRTALLKEIHDCDSEEDKQRLWSLEEELEECSQRAEGEFRETTTTYQAVLNIDPGDRPSRSALADLYLKRLEETEGRGESEAAAVYAGLVAHFQSEAHAARLRGDGMLELDSRPSGAEVYLHRFRQRGRRLVEEGGELVGRTPIERPLPMGSYLLVLKLRGYRETRYPVLIERCGAHQSVVHLYEDSSIPPGFIHVPAGPAIVGGTSDVSLPRQRSWIGDLFVGEFPVTFEAYCAFLNDPQRGAAVDEFLPFFGREYYTVENAKGEHVPRLDPALPVFAIPAAAALEYCRWYGRKIGREGVRLLREIEWEKCARGADGRIFPWGNRFDWSFAKGGRSRKGEPYPEPVGRFARDSSPYGIRDLAGCVREFTGDWFAENYRACRGGSWFNGFENIFRADMRTYCREGNRVTDIGFRVAFDGRPSREGGGS